MANILSIPRLQEFFKATCFNYFFVISRKKELNCFIELPISKKIGEKTQQFGAGSVDGKNKRFCLTLEIVFLFR